MDRRISNSVVDIIESTDPMEKETQRERGRERERERGRGRDRERNTERTIKANVFCYRQVYAEISYCHKKRLATFLSLQQPDKKNVQLAAASFITTTDFIKLFYCDNSNFYSIINSIYYTDSSLRRQYVYVSALIMLCHR